MIERSRDNFGDIPGGEEAVDPWGEDEEEDGDDSDKGEKE